MTEQTAPSGRRPQRLWAIGGIGLVIAAVIVGVALFLGGSDDGDQISSARVKNGRLPRLSATPRMTLS